VQRLDTWEDMIVCCCKSFSHDDKLEVNEVAIKLDIKNASLSVPVSCERIFSTVITHCDFFVLFFHW
jgi:hypothetical protein